MKFILLISLIALCTFQVAECAEFLAIDGKNYYVSTPDQANWYQAMRFCAYHGMHLIDVGTYFENIRVLQVIEKTRKKNNLTCLDYWTSGTSLGSDQQFYWATSGQPVFWEYWAYDEPSRGGNENCLHYYCGKASKWNNIDCNTKMNFICRDTLDIPVYKNRECAVLG